MSRTRCITNRRRKATTLALRLGLLPQNTHLHSQIISFPLLVQTHFSLGLHD